MLFVLSYKKYFCEGNICKENLTTEIWVVTKKVKNCSHYR